MKNILLIGYGNIAKKHIKHIKKIIPSSSFFILKKRIKKIKNKKNISFIKNIKDVNSIKISYILICSPTSTHLEYLKKLSKFKAPIFMEKPLTNNFSKLKKIIKNKNYLKTNLIVGYVFRYSDNFRTILKLINKGKLRKIKYVKIKASSYLPDWRKNRNFRKTNSAQKKFGGGVLLELSHEIDYLIQFFGMPIKLLAKLTSSKKLNLNVESGAKCILFYKKNLTIDLQLDFHSKNKNLRYCNIYCEDKKLSWNLKNQNISFFDKNKNVFKYKKNYNEMFYNQMKFFLNNKKNFSKKEFIQYYKILNIIEHIKKSNKLNRIVYYNE